MRAWNTAVSWVLVGVLVLGSLGALAGCESMGKRETGAAVGAGSGAVLGGIVGGENRALGAGVGLVLGALAGYAIGDYMQNKDQQEVATTLETTPSGQTSSWVNPDTNTQWSATPQQAYQQNGQVYRDVRIAADTNNDGQYDEFTTATATRRDDGTWEFVEQ